MRRLRNCLRKLAKAVYSVANGVVEGTTGLPLWAWGLIGVSVVGAVGYGVYKIGTGPLGQAAVGAATSHYLGRR